METTLKDYLEYQFAAEQMRQLRIAQKSILTALHKRPKDINLEANLRRIENDLGVMAKVVTDKGFDILEQMENELDYEFQFLNRPEPNSERIVEAAIPKMKVKKNER